MGDFNPAMIIFAFIITATIFAVREYLKRVFAEDRERRKNEIAEIQGIVRLYLKHGEATSYGISTIVEAHRGGMVGMGTLFVALERMEQSGEIIGRVETDEEMQCRLENGVEGPRRRYYREADDGQDKSLW